MYANCTRTKLNQNVPAQNTCVKSAKINVQNTNTWTDLVQNEFWMDSLKKTTYAGVNGWTYT